MKLSENAEEILEAMWIAIEENGGDFAAIQYIGIDSRDPAYAELVDSALIELKDGHAYFFEKGREEGRQTIRRHRLAERLLMDVLDIRGEEGDKKACQFEHLLKEGVDIKVCNMLNHPSTCPHGKQIPMGDCCTEARKSGNLGVLPLTELNPKEDGEIAFIQTKDSKIMHKLMSMGVLPGNQIYLVQNFPSYIFRIGYSEFAIDSEMADKIYVRQLVRQ
ncbi:MAG: metal-dependent transcriptional regulator [Nitrospirae bacterium]|nr:metal-dependent transcriptional regulator [Nitrospirota bacterium]